jgi:8-oxo-dGTP pyrophosphatase MutT (NUDIX family)
MLPDETLGSVLDPATTEWRSRPELRDAAVLVPWFTRERTDFILYTKRTPDLKSHAGEVSFPGGSREGDEHALACALREAREEIGLDLRAVTILGRLPERVSIASYLVQVESLIELAVPDLQDRSRWRWRDLVSAAGVHRKVPFYECVGGPLWGLTAVFTLDLLERLRSANPG